MTDDELFDRAPWTPVEASTLLRRTRSRRPGPSVVAVDGRSGSGKTTLATALAAASERAAKVVHTDDIAWHESMFEWDRLVLDHVLAPLRRGEGVAFRPQAWARRGRAGSIDVPPKTSLVLLEGVGAARASLRSHVDATVWVHAPRAVRLARAERRIGAGQVTAELSAEWLREEDAFLAEERTWKSCDLVADGGASRPALPNRIWTTSARRTTAP